MGEAAEPDQHHLELSHQSAVLLPSLPTCNEADPPAIGHDEMPALMYEEVAIVPMHDSAGNQELH